MKYSSRLLIVIVIFLLCYIAYSFLWPDDKSPQHRVVLCIPVYGQSLALGEEATRITNFDSLRINYDGRIVTECLDYGFGYNDDIIIKQRLKKLLHYHKRSFELSVYGMAEELVTQLGEDTIVCIFPGGRGMSRIKSINKGTSPYRKFLYELQLAYKEAKKKGWEFYVPAICWMHGESDIIDYTNSDYKYLLKQFQIDISQVVKAITHQENDIPLICYQSNVLTRAKHFNANDFESIEMKVSQAVVELIRDDTMFWASGPTYPYNIVNEKLHIDGIGQRHIGGLEAIAALKIIRKDRHDTGLYPDSISISDNNAIIHFNTPQPPLVLDTLTVSTIKHYGFNVITREGKDILSKVIIGNNTVTLACSESPINCKIRYAVNGEKMKSGHLHGPRGNLRDSQGNSKSIKISDRTYPLHNWCYQFDLLCTPNK